MQRTPLGLISANHTPNRQYNPSQRALLIGALSVGATPYRIQKQYRVPESSVRYINSRFILHPNGAAPRTGRPPKLSERDRRKVVRIARRNPTITYRQLAKDAGVSLSHDTLYRLLKEEGITNWVCKRRPLLTPEVAGKRYAWALEHQNWTYEDWLKVIWSDECSVERGSGKRRQWAFRTPQEKWKKDMIQPKRKGKDISIVVWACFCGLNRSELYVLSRDPDAKRNGYSANSYIQVLEDNLLGIYEPGLTFMQDNAPIHAAKKVKKWLEEQGITIMEWPPYSPDLNPIEHLWFLLKEGVYRVNPDIENVGGNDETIQEELFKALFRSWEEIKESYLDRLVKSMERRVKAVIAAEGWYTKY